MKMSELLNEDGRIVKGVNTTVDVGPNEIKTQASKFGNSVTKDGVPPTLSKKVKGKSTNVLFNLGLAEGIKLRLERDKHIDVLHIQDTKEKHRVEVRGKKGYESGNYDPQDKLHQVLDRVGKAANISELMNGEVVSINPNHPQGTRAIRTARDVLTTESVSKDELRKQLAMGVKVEMEHTDDPQLALKIAMDHIREDPLYYDHLKFVEGRLKSRSYRKSYRAAKASGRRKRKKLKTKFRDNIETENKSFVEPQFDVEWEEAERYPEFVKIGKEAWIELASKGKAVTITDASDINNTDAADPDSFDQLDPAKQKRALAQLENGDVEMPIVAVYSDGWKELIGGNTRLTAMMARDGQATVWEFKVPDSILENFADGKKKEIYEALGEIASSTEIYVDMDGVLADFFGEWARLMDVDHFTQINKVHDIDDALQKIRDTDDFWLRLPMLPEAKNLLNLIKQVKGSYNICSSPLADDPNSEKHKRTWIEQNLSFFPPDNVYITHNKPQYATQEDGTPNILIDDYGVNINAWEAAGGIGFKYKNHKFERTANAIKQHMQEPVEENFADGKVKGKSRPGRVKRAGASCNGSVTSLRKRAKNSSGEKARMYHWCANMKSGRKKKS